VSLPHSNSNGGPSDGENRGLTNPCTWKKLDTGTNRIVEIRSRSGTEPVLVAWVFLLLFQL
jgi:hypothetical protein